MLSLHWLNPICLAANDEEPRHVIFQQNETKLFYTPEDDRYHLTLPDQHISDPRFQYEDFKENIRSHIPSDELERVHQRIDQHYLLQRLSNPSDEEMLEEALATRDLSLGIIEYGQSFPCGQNPDHRESIQGPTRYEIQLSDEQAQGLDQSLREKLIRENTFMEFGELTGLEIEFETGNDNFLLGGTSALGITEHAEGIEGDDRGKTMNQDLSLAFVFDEGEIKLATSSTGYGELVGVEVPQQVKMVGSSGTNSQTEYEYRDEDGKYYQNYLSVDGVVLEVKRNLDFGQGSQDDEQLYVRVVGTREEFDDQDGLGQSIQENWHAELSHLSDSSVEYNYQDHMDAFTRYSAKIELGKDEVIRATNDYEISLDRAVGVQLSNRDSGRQINMRGGLRIASADGEEDNRYPTWEGEVYLEGGMDRNREEFIYTGAEITRRFHVSDNSSLAFSGGMSYEDDPLSRSFSSEELEDNGGRLDLYHTLKIRFEHRF